MSNEFLVGAGAGIVGLLVGLAFGGPDETRIANTVSQKVGSALESAAPENSEQITALSAEIAELKTAIATVTEAQSGSESAVAAKLDEAVEALNARMDAVSSDVGAAVTEAGSAQAADIAALIGETSASQTSQIEAAIATGMQGLESSVSRIAASAATVPAPAEDDDTAAAVAPAAEEAPAIEGTRVGETESLLDGKVRVFVSGVDAEAQKVRVAINGLGMQILGQYRGVAFDADGTSCELTLDGIIEGHVQMSASCAE